MIPVSKARLSAPKPVSGEITRAKLVTAVFNSIKQIVYIHAGAGYGKTTLLSQVANSAENSIWVTLDGESDVFAFLNILSEALRQVFSDFSFNSTEYLPFENNSNFITILANAFINNLEKYNQAFIFILDDLHTINNSQIRELLACIIKYKPENIRFCLGSREFPWQELSPFRVRDNILELTQQELAFTRNETMQILGFEDDDIFNITEGWPIAVCSFKVLLENGVSVVDIPSYGKETLHSYLLYECVNRLPSEMVTFLKSSACFEELDPLMLNEVLGQRNARLLFESLVARNMFTTKTNDGYYRYHPLFRDFLLETADSEKTAWLQSQAARYYFAEKQYDKAAEYAMRLEDKQILAQIVLTGYRDYIRRGSFSELRLWFNALGDVDTLLSRELLVAKGAFLSSVGNFLEAKTCLDSAIPRLSENDGNLYIESMVHKARVLRNFISFEESNQLLDDLMTRLDRTDTELAYGVIIEKIFNLCWNSQINEAHTLTCNMIKVCAQTGNVKVMTWYERYLSVIYYVMGRMKDSVYHYEKSQSIPENEQQYLDMHSIDIYVAKAYQMLGQREKAVSMVTEGLQKLRNTGRYEELWLGYLFAAEIHYQNTSIDRMNGSTQTYETTIKYFTLANEYAVLYRKSAFQMNWAKMQHNISSLMFTSGAKDKIISEISDNLHLVGDHFKTIALGRLYNYFGSIGDFVTAAKFARHSIEIGECANTMMVATMSYGFLSRIALDNRNHAEAVRLISRFLQLCKENGIYEYFRMRKAYDPILEFAYYNGIEPDFTEQMMAFAGYKTKKVYIATLGVFSVSSNPERQPLKMRTKRERELLAFLLDAGSKGVTKEQIAEVLWHDSESNDVKKLIGVNLAHIKQDLAKLGVSNPIINQEKHYRILRDEIVVDIDLFEEATQEFKQQNNYEAAQKMIALYKGEYLSDFEAHWAVYKRIKCLHAYNEAVTYCEQAQVRGAE